MNAVKSCPMCKIELVEPYVNCEDCHIQFCCKCFARGKEIDEHKNDHAYSLKSSYFSLFEEKWTAAEEIQLLEATKEYGFGNWDEISSKLTSKPTEECKAHYLKCYIDSPEQPLPEFKISNEKSWRRPMKYKPSQLPPRPDNCADDLLVHVGYMPARGDFIIEWDNYAECDVKNVEFNAEEEDDELIFELNLAVADIYYRRMKDREKKKRLMRDYGLLDATSSHNSLLFAYSRTERHLRSRMVKFAPFTRPEKHEKFVQLILYQKQLQKQIKRLQEYRNMGLRKLRDAKIYEKLKQKRAKLRANPSKLNEILLHKDNPAACQIWLQRQLNCGKRVTSLPFLPLDRRKAPPMDLTDLPDLDKLSPAEKELCSSARLLPSTYLRHKEVLQRASFHQNGLQLKDARGMLKMDVNKTRRLFEFCVEQGFIKCVNDVSSQ